MMTQEQQDAVTTSSPELMCVASAGSGKTRVLVERVRRLVRNGTPEHEICVVTFTNAGANEFKRRLGVTVGWCGTLHSLCLLMLRDHPGVAGLRDGGSIVVADDSMRDFMLEECLEECNSGRKIAPAKLVEALKPGVLDIPAGSPLSKEQVVAKSYYRKMLAEGAMDFDMLLHFGAKAAKSCHYRHLLVDEVQDSSPEDWAVYDALPVITRFYVGDPDQAIFGFRGGDVGLMVNRAGIDGVISVHLSENFRSGASIVEYAERAVSRNKVRLPKPATLARAGGTVGVADYQTPADELAAVTIAVLSTVARGETVAVLARTNVIAASFVSALSSLGVKVASRGPVDTPSADRAKAAALVSAAFRPWNDRSVFRLVRICGRPAIAKEMWRVCLLERRPMWQLANLPWTEAPKTVAELLDISRQTLSVQSVAHDMVKLAAELTVANGDKLTEQNVILSMRQVDEPVEREGVFVGTVHSAKGLEWDNVFLVSCEQGTFPSAKADVEEEARLFYVACTRAKNNLRLSWCRTRPQSRGPKLPAGPAVDMAPSQFLNLSCQATTESF